MIDLHAHVLCGIDDGPSNLDGLVEIADSMVDRGVSAVACTPHVSWVHDNSPQTIASALDVARSELTRRGISLTLLSGAEVGLTRALELSDNELRRLCLGGGEWLLLEAPLDISGGVEPAVRAIVSRGHRVLLAHPERCPAFQREPDALRRLLGAGVRAQITASALTGSFGSVPRRFALELGQEGLIDVVASDAHDARGRPPGLREHILEAGFGEAQVAHWTRDVPAAIVFGGTFPPPPIPAPPPPPRRRRWFRSR